MTAPAHADAVHDLLVHVPLPAVVVDRFGHIVAANPAAERFLSAPTELVGRLVIRHVDPESRRAVRRAISTGIAPPSPVLIRGIDETVPVPVPVPVPVHLLAVKNDDGTVTLLFVERAGEAAAERRARELAAELEQTQAAMAAGEPGASAVRRVRIGRLLEHIRQGVVALDSGLVVQFVNTAALELLDGVELGKSLPSKWNGFDLGSFGRSLFERQALYAEALVEGGESLVRLGGIPAVDGLALIMATDVTESVRQDRAERDFVTNAAHELLNPIAAIASAADALELAEADEEVRRRFIEHLVREARRLDRLVNALLDLARMQHRDEPPQLEPLALRLFLDTIAGQLRPHPDVRVHVLCPPTLAFATNETLLHHAVLNLATNAARHTTAGEIRLGATRIRRAVVIDVDDSGPGIPPAERSRVLERFHRGQRGGEGFGLGLAIAGQALEALSGKLTLCESPLGGTRARITLPIQEAP